jgi:hypothetical protein
MSEKGSFFSYLGLSPALKPRKKPQKSLVISEKTYTFAGDK